MSLFLRLPTSRPASTDAPPAHVARAWWTTCRPEFVIVPTLTQAAMVALLALHQQAADLRFAWRLLVGLVIWCMSLAVGGSLNCLADYETDRLDSGGKARLARAVDILGSGRLWRIILAEISMLAFGVLVLMLLLRRPLLAGLWLSGLLLAVAYSFEPYRLKGRGLLSPAVASGTCVVLPMLFMVHLLTSQPSGPALAAIGLFGAQSCGLMLVEQVSDCEEDRRTATRTACVRYGRPLTIALGAVVYALGSAGMVAAAWRFWPATTTGALVLRLLALGLYAWVLLELVRLGRRARALERGGRAVLVVAVPRWALMVGLGAWLLVGRG